jgi:hypothetical protein
MDDIKNFAPAAALPEIGSGTANETTAATAPPAGDAAVSLSLQRFKSCRWRATPDQGEFCTHRDVLPFAGKEGFNADSWCGECGFYKLRRTPKKRDYSAY